jgi:hypothetical protein
MHFVFVFGQKGFDSFWPSDVVRFCLLIKGSVSFWQIECISFLYLAKKDLILSGRQMLFVFVIDQEGSDSLWQFECFSFLFIDPKRVLIRSGISFILLLQFR